MVDHALAGVVGGQCFAQVFSEFELAVGAGDYGYTRELGDFARLELGVTAGHDDLGLRIAATERAYGLTTFFVGHLCDRAGVNNYKVGVVTLMDTLNPLGGKELCHRGGLGEIKLATECVEKRSAVAEGIVVYQCCKFLE